MFSKLCIISNASIGGRYTTYGLKNFINTVLKSSNKVSIFLIDHVYSQMTSTTHSFKSKKFIEIQKKKENGVGKEDKNGKVSGSLLYITQYMQ